MGDTTESLQLKELRMRRMGIDKQIRQITSDLRRIQSELGLRPSIQQNTDAMSVGSGVTLQNVNSEEDKKKKRKKVSGKKTEEENVANKKKKYLQRKRKRRKCLMNVMTQPE